ncbi:cylicin-1 [Ailuropoda melanoleuca]|uniref:cylicin-1 n=1 Tax=Ailuropoda melanoleuca TaxID=9646 RepID=UPI0001DED3DE|nr:cylicin-1 [Ailuropoda melanoleuca]
MHRLQTPHLGPCYVEHPRALPSIPGLAPPTWPRHHCAEYLKTPSFAPSSASAILPDHPQCGKPGHPGLYLIQVQLSCQDTFFMENPRITTTHAHFSFNSPPKMPSTPSIPRPLTLYLISAPATPQGTLCSENSGTTWFTSTSASVILPRQEVNIRTNDNSISINESSRRLWNQDYFTLTFPKPLQPGRKKRSRPSESQISVPRHDKRKLEEVWKPAHIRIRHSLKKFSQRPSVYLTVRRQAPFRNPYTLKAHPENGERKKPKDDKKGRTLQRISKKSKGLHETTTESKMVNDEKPKRGNKEDKTPSKLSHKSELSKDSKYKLEINPESNDFKAVSMYPKKDKKDSKISKETYNEFICAKKDSKGSMKNSDTKSQTCSKNISNMDFILYLEESIAESTKCEMWLKNYSQNNSKKPSKKDTKKDAKKTSDAESVDSKDAKKDKKGVKKDNKKKDAKKDTESTDAESVDSKDAKKDSKKAKKGSKKNDKKKDTKKDAVATDAETESELETKNLKKFEKKDKKDSKKYNKKKDAKKDVVSTDTDSESEWDSTKGKNNEKKDKRNSKKDDKNKFAMKSEESTETESDWESKKDKYNSKKTKKDSKKDAKKQDAKKGIESTDAESDESSKKDSKKPETFKSSDAESEESLYKLGTKKRVADESDATSTDSKKKALELKREFKTASKKTTFKEKGKKTGTGRVPPSRERPPLPPCEPLLPSPKFKRLCRCQMPPAPQKPRYAPLLLVRESGRLPSAGGYCFRAPKRSGSLPLPFLF